MNSPKRNSAHRSPDGTRTKENLEASLSSTSLARSLSADTIAHINTFANWAKTKGVRKCPCKPFVLAAFIQEHNALGVPPEQIITIVKAVDDLHQYHALASPLYTQVARAALDQAIKVTAPRGWNKDERGAFDALVDPLIRQAVSRHEWLRDRDLRRKQNEISELKKTAIEWCRY